MYLKLLTTSANLKKNDLKQTSVEFLANNNTQSISETCH
jgi:hypothetical protein